MPVNATSIAPSFYPDTVKPDSEISRLEAVQTINSVMSWWEDYRIETEQSFWARLWLSIRKFVGYLTLDFDRLLGISKSKNPKDIFIAKRWGIALDDADNAKKISGWQFLELQSQALSKALNYSGINRTLTEEVQSIRLELKSVSKSLDASYADIIASNIIQKPMRAFKPDEAWVYYIFATQHDLLPPHEGLTPQELLNPSMKGSDLKKFTEKLVLLLDQMAQDLGSGE
jgi:hypothetical protein